MKKYNIHIQNTNEDISVLENTTLLSLSKSYSHALEGTPIVAMVDNALTPLNAFVNSDCSVEFLDITHPEGFRVYQRTCAFIMFTAIYSLFGTKYNAWVKHSINKNYYCSFKDADASEEVLNQIKAKMRAIIDSDFAIEKIIVSIDEAMDIFKEYKFEHICKSIKYIKASNVSLYSLNGFFDYDNGCMAPSTGFIKYFDITKSGTNFVLQFENPSQIGTVNPHVSFPKLTSIYNEYEYWAEILGIHTVGSLNDIICAGNIEELILICEALHEKKIAYIADSIFRDDKKLVLIAGPSSSGKTTFAKRLSIQLRANGLMPMVISLDDYYRNRKDIPVEENGLRNYENIESLDLELFNKNLVDILAGKAVKTPLYNFHTGMRSKETKLIKLGTNDVLLIEGIHGINEKLTYKIPRDQKFKIYISALTQLSIDEHNRIATTDTRLIRRIVRDHYFRGFSAASTIEMWANVLTGEEKNIFPYQEDTDVIFNSALAYEISVLKPLVEPLLFDIDRGDVCYREANRLLNFLNNFLTVSSAEIPTNSLLREFLGNSIFYK